MPFINSDKALQTLKGMQAEIAVIETEAPVMLTQLMGYVRAQSCSKMIAKLKQWLSFT